MLDLKGNLVGRGDEVVFSVGVGRSNSRLTIGTIEDFRDREAPRIYSWHNQVMRKEAKVRYNVNGRNQSTWKRVEQVLVTKPAIDRSKYTALLNYKGFTKSLSYPYDSHWGPRPWLQHHEMELIPVGGWNFDEESLESAETKIIIFELSRWDEDKHEATYVWRP